MPFSLRISVLSPPLHLHLLILVHILVLVLPVLINMGEASSVKVAVRVRPMNRNEQMEGCKDVLTSPPSSSLPLSSGSSSPLSSSSSSASTKQIFLGSGSEKSFTFDEVFGWQVPQSVVFATCVSPLLDRFIEGYNGTILAYGQTGSGKTYSMGTASSASASASSASPADFQAALDDVSLGIIPRSAVKLFEALRQMEAKAQRMGLPRPLFEVRTSFLELYNEELIDLLHKDSSAPSSIRIKEDPTEGGIQLVGLTEEQVTSPRDLLLCLERGAANRTTGATEMNKTSSRSHGPISSSSVILSRFDSFPTLLSALYSFCGHQNSHFHNRAPAETPRWIQGQWHGHSFLQGMQSLLHC